MTAPKKKPARKASKTAAKVVPLEDGLLVQEPPDNAETLRIIGHHISQIMERCQVDTIQVVVTKIIPQSGGQVDILADGAGNLLARESSVTHWLDRSNRKDVEDSDDEEG